MERHGSQTGKTGGNDRQQGILGYVDHGRLRRSGDGPWAAASFIPTGSPVGTAGCGTTLVHRGGANTYVVNAK